MLYQVTKQALGEGHPDTLRGMNNSAWVLRHQGKFEQVEEMHRRTLDDRERVLGRDHPDTLRSMNNSALALNHQDKHEQAAEIHRQAIDVTAPKPLRTSKFSLKGLPLGMSFGEYSL